MIRVLYLLLIPFLFAGTAHAQRPVLLTESARTLGSSLFETGIGIEYLEKHTAPGIDFPLTEFRASMAGITLGVSGNVDFALEWRGSLIATYPTGATAYDWGDITITTKINFVDKPNSFPNIGMRTAVKLPSTSYLPHKLGSDMTDFFFQFLLSGSIGGVESRVNAGFGIIGNPMSSATQNDIFSLSAAAIVPLNTDVSIFAELCGFKGYFGGDGKLALRGGTLWRWLDVEWNVFGSLRALGDNRDFATAFELSENWSVGVYLKKQISW